MRRRIVYVVVLLLLVIIVSCKSEASLQRYYIDHQSSKNFNFIDVPASIISLKEDASPTSKKALKSLRKLNILIFERDNANVLEFKAEQKKIKTILKDKKYIELFRVSDKGRFLTIKYMEGDDEEAVDEVYLYASDKSEGFALIRVLGDNMRADDISALINDIREIDGDSEPLKKIDRLLKK